MPDVNSIPPSPSRSRRPTGSMGTAAHPSGQPSQLPLQSQSPSSINILPSNQQAVNNSALTGSLPSPSLPISSTSGMAPPPAPGHDNAGVGAGPGPIRHPRPLTAAELHSQLEQEQELLVNRLTRDLTMLRAAHNSSVVSNTSSTSASTTDQGQHPSSFTDTHLLSGPGFPIPTTSADRRHHRTSSSTSARSFSQLASQGSTPAPIPIPHQSHHPGTAASVLEAARNPRGATSMSRQNSTASHRSVSRNHSPGPYHGSNASLGPSSYSQSHGFPHGGGGGGGGGGDPSYFRHLSSNPSTTAAATPGSEMSPGLMAATHRYEETAHYRQELETAKRENENLKRRIKELERKLRDRRESDASRGRSESVSTTASVSVSGTTGVGNVVGGGTGIAPGRREETTRRRMERATSSISVAGSVNIGVPDEELKVGESAASAGLRTAPAPTADSPVTQQQQQPPQQ